MSRRRIVKHTLSVIASCIRHVAVSVDTATPRHTSRHAGLLYEYDAGQYGE